MGYCYRVESSQHSLTYLDRVSGLSVRQAYPGGFHSCSFTVPGLVEIAPFSRLTISKGPVVVFDGEIRDRRHQTGPGGKSTALTAYGHGILLTDDQFGPRVYADTRLREWREPVVGFAFGSYTYAPTKEKFTLGTDGDALRIAPKPSAVFAGQAAGGADPVLSVLGHDFAGYEYQLPLAAEEVPYGTLAQVVVTWATAFPTGNWELVAISSDGASIGVHSIATATGSGTATITPMAGATSIALVLRAKADQAVWPGFVDDGAGSSPAHVLEYAGKWNASLNASGGGRQYRDGGGMETEDNTTSVSTARDGSNFYPDGTTRTGGAARLKFTGRDFKWYAQKWGAFGQTEIRIWNAAGTLLGGYPVTIDAYQSPSRTWQQVLHDATLDGFGTYTATLRNLGTSAAGPAGPTYYTNVDYFDIGVARMDPFEQDAVYAEISAVSVKTTTARLDAAQIARDMIAFYSDAAIGLSAGTFHVPTTTEAATLLPAVTHHVYDGPTTGADALDDICALGSSADKPAGWAVWEKKMLQLEEWDTTGARFLYRVEPGDVAIEYETTIQEDFANVVAEVYRDGLGQRIIGVDQVSARVDTEHGGRRRRTVLTPQEDQADAGTYLGTYLANHDRPSARARVTVIGPIRDQGGAVVPPDEVRAGHLLQVGGFDEWGRIGATDRRGGFTAMIVGLEWDADNRRLSLELGEGPNDLERMLARVERQQQRDRQGA